MTTQNKKRFYVYGSWEEQFEILSTEEKATMLMNLFLSLTLVSIERFPEIELECTGNLNVGSKVIMNPISSQTKFFRKFGFRVVKEESEYPEYVKMKFDFSKFVENEENIMKIINR